MREGKPRRLFRMVVPRHPAVNIYSHIARRTTALGPLLVATSVNRLPGWDVEVIDENNYHHPGPLDKRGLPDHEALQRRRPADAVGFYGGLSSTIPRLLELAAWYRGQGLFAIGGGQHLEALPEEALCAGLDAVVLGEGELAVRELLTAWAAGAPLEQVPGVVCLRDGAPAGGAPRPPLRDFDALPLPEFGLLRFARLKVFPVNRIRGCGMNCEFCTVKGRARCATPERLMAQISCVVETYRARLFFIVDDQFAQDRAETIRFCQLLKEYQQSLGLRLKFTVQIRLDCARDAELLAAMRAAGINGLAIGIESPIDEELEAMGKHLRSAEMVELARAYHRAGFLVHGMFIFGYPMPPGIEFRLGAKERVRRFRRFIRKARLDTLQVLLPAPLPGTVLRERLEREGRVLPLSEVGWKYYDGNFPLFLPDAPLTPEDLHRSILALMGGFYRLRRVFGLVLHTLRFPLAMLPLTRLRQRWRNWYRHWRNDVLGSVGYFAVGHWRRAFRTDNFAERLERGRRLLRRGSSPAAEQARAD